MMNFELVLFQERSLSRPPAGGSGSYGMALLLYQQN
jgi:hypothetical protein